MVAAIQRVALASAAGGGGWPLSGGWKGLEARGGAQRAREWALEAARPPAPAISEPGWISESGCSSERPREASSPGDWGHLPDACLDSPAPPVLLVALVVFAAKTSGLATAISQPGIWFYALSVVALAVASLDKS